MGFFGRRDSDGVDPHLDLKIFLFFVAAALGLIGIFTDTVWWIYAALLVIVLGFLLRFLPSREE